jgi:hypothetical protein
MNLPDFIIIGETKCATTSLFNYLLKHPQIQTPFGNGDEVDYLYSSKEIRYFDRYYARGIDWYKSCFPDKKQGFIVGEATPMYMYRSMVPYRIKKEVPHCKFIVLLRNPVDRLYSNFQHYFKWVPNWSNQYPTFENYITACNDRDYFMIDKGIYATSLKRWFKTFPQEQFIIKLTENLISEPQNVYTQVLSFLSIDDYANEDYPILRKNKYTNMKPSTREMLEDYYHPFNIELQNLLGKTFNW